MVNFAPPLVGPSLAQLAMQIPQTYRDARTAANRERSLARLAQTGTLDPNSIGLALLEAGDTGGAMAAANLAQSAEDRAWRRSTDTRDFGFREAEANRAQANTEAEREFRRRTIERQEMQPVTIQGPNGPITAVPVPGQPGVFRAPQVAGQPAPSNPYADGRFNEGQGRAAGFADRMFQSEDVLRQTESEGTNTTQGVLSRVPYVGNFLTSANRQRYEQAQRDFINAQLRRESGAVITEAEFDNARRQYFPQPGDSPEVIEQKRRNRQAAIAAMAREGGPSYRPGYTFDDRGTMTRRPTRPQQQQPSPAAPQPAAPAPAPQQQYREGQLARMPDGSVIVYRNGEWVPRQ